MSISNSYSLKNMPDAIARSAMGARKFTSDWLNRAFHHSIGIVDGLVFLVTALGAWAIA